MRGIVTVNRSLHWMVSLQMIYQSYLKIKIVCHLTDSLSADEQPANEENLMDSPKSPLDNKIEENHPVFLPAPPYV